MTQSKLFHNDTSRPVSLTIYIGGRNSGAVEAFGTRKLVLEPEQAEEVSYGDLHHPFIEGVEITRQVAGVESSYKVMVNGGSPLFEKIVNETDLISLSTIEAAFQQGRL